MLKFLVLVIARHQIYPVRVDIILVFCVMVHMQRLFDKLLLLH